MFLRDFSAYRNRLPTSAAVLEAECVAAGLELPVPARTFGLARARLKSTRLANGEQVSLSADVGLPCCCCCSFELAAGVHSDLVAIEPAATAGPTKQEANGRLLWRLLLLLSAPRAAVAAVAANRNTTISIASRASAVMLCGLLVVCAADFFLGGGGLWFSPCPVAFRHAFQRKRVGHVPSAPRGQRGAGWTAV